MREVKGLTLVELLITLVVAGIFLVWAVPSYINTVMNTKITSITNSLVGTVNFARNQAITRGTGVSVCSSQNQSSCANGQWGSSWIVFTDGSTLGTIDGSDQILRVIQDNSVNITITITGANYVHFAGEGFLSVENDTPLLLDRPSLTRFVSTILGYLPINNAYAASSSSSSSSTTEVSFTICDSKRSGETGRQISILGAGRISTSMVTCS